jgi:hypothetical protein
MSKTRSSIFKENPLHEIGEDLGRYIMKLSRITFFDEPVTYDVFFKENDLFKYSYKDGNSGIYIITLIENYETDTVKANKTYFYIKKVFKEGKNVEYEIYKIRHPDLLNENSTDNLLTSKDAVVSFNVRYYNIGNHKLLSEVSDIIRNKPREFFQHFIWYYSYNKKPIIEFDRKIMETNNDPMIIINKGSSGGSKASVNKEICGKLRCIYKIPGSRKEHIKYKGRLIAVADYKKLMKKA